MAASGQAATQAIAPLNFSQPQVTNPQSGSAGGAMPAPVSPVDIAKQRSDGNMMAAQEGQAMEQQQQMHDQQLAQQQEGFKQQEATMQAEQAKQQAEQTMRQAEEIKKQNEKALADSTKSMEKQRDTIVKSQLSSLKSTGNRVSGAAQRAGNILKGQGKALGQMASIKMASAPQPGGGSAAMASGPVATPQKVQQPQQPQQQPPQQPPAGPQPGGGASSTPIRTIGTPSRSQQQIEGANYSTYNQQVEGLRQPGGATYQTPMGGTVSTVPSGKPSGIYDNGVLMVKNPQTGQYVPASQAAPPQQQSVQIEQPQDPGGWDGSSQVAPQPEMPQVPPAAPVAPPASPEAPPQAPAPQQQAPAPQDMTDMPGMHRRALEPAEPDVPVDHFTMAQAAGGDPGAMEQYIAQSGVDPASGEPLSPEDAPELMAYLKEKTDDRRMRGVHDGVMDDELLSDDPATSSWARDTLARQYIDSQGIGTHNEAADYFHELYPDNPELAQQMGEKVWSISNDRVRQNHAADQSEEYGMNAPWWNLKEKLPGMGARLFDEVTGADEVALNDALFQRPEVFGSSTLSDDQRKTNMAHQLARMQDRQEVIDRWQHRHMLDQDDMSQFGRNFMANVTEDSNIYGDSLPGRIVNNLSDKGAQALGGMAGGFDDVGRAADRFGADKSWDNFKHLAGQTGELGWDTLDAGLNINPVGSGAALLKAPKVIAALGGAGMGYNALSDPEKSLDQKLDDGDVEHLPLEGPGTSPMQQQQPGQPQQPGQMPDASNFTQWLQQNPQLLMMLLPMLLGGRGGGMGGGQPHSTAGGYYSHPAFYGGQYAF